jgi:hypothetical protein
MLDGQQHDTLHLRQVHDDRVRAAAWPSSRRADPPGANLDEEIAAFRDRCRLALERDLVDPSSGSTRRPSAAPTSSVSSPTPPRCSAWPAPCWSRPTMSGRPPPNAATCPNTPWNSHRRQEDQWPATHCPRPVRPLRRPGVPTDCARGRRRVAVLRPSRARVGRADPQHRSQRAGRDERTGSAVAVRS